MSAEQQDKAQLYKKAMEMFRDDIANELGLTDKIEEVGWAGMTAKECGFIGGKMGGKLGGNMVKKMIQMAQQEMVVRESEGAPPKE